MMHRANHVAHFGASAAVLPRSVAAVSATARVASAFSVAAASHNVRSYASLAAASATRSVYKHAAAHPCACSACVTAARALPSAATGAPAFSSRGFASQPQRQQPRKAAPAPVRPTTAGSAARPASRPAVPQRATAPMPTLNAILKKFNLLVHPDLFGESPAHGAANQVALQALNSLLTTLKTRNKQDSYPEKQVLKLIFHIKKKRGEEKWAEYVRSTPLEQHLAGKGASQQNGRSQQGQRRSSTGSTSGLPPRGTETLEGEFYIVPVVVSTNGSQCQKLVQSQLANLFYRCGLPHSFTWDAEYWQMGAMRLREDMVREQRDEEAAANADEDGEGQEVDEDGQPFERERPWTREEREAERERNREPEPDYHERSKARNSSQWH